MDAILKFIFDSQKLLITAFVTCAVLYFGPRYAPSLVPSVPEPWGSGPVAGMVLSGMPLLLWWAASLSRGGRKALKALRMALVSKELSVNEQVMLRALATRDGYWLNLREFPHEHRIELDLLCIGLEAKGFVSRSEVVPEVVELTGSGKLRAIQLRAEARENGSMMAGEDVDKD